MSQRSAQHISSAPGANASAPSPRRGKLLELARRLEEVGRRVEGFIDEQLVQLEQAEALVQSRRRTNAETTPGDLQHLRDVWQREHRDEIRKVEEDRRVLAEAWLRLEAEQRQLIAARDTKRELARSTPEPTELTEQTPTLQASSERSKNYENKTSETKENGRVPMAPSMRQAMMRQFQQLRNDVRKHAQRRQQC